MEYTGRIVKAVGGRYTVLIRTGEPVGVPASEADPLDRELLCSARGIFRKDGENSPLAGDVADIAPDPNDPELGSVLRLHSRKNALIRPAMANIDVLFIVFAPADPPPDLTTIDKLTCIAVNSGIRPVICVNKADLGDTSLLTDIYRLAGFEAHSLSGATGEGVEELLPALTGSVSAFAGASGVGKSSLLNALFPGLGLATNTTSEKISRGRHTTRAVRLFRNGYGGFVADTPGFSLLDFTRFDFVQLHELAGCFPEFAPFLGECRYTKCTHTVEQGCAILDALGKGGIAPSRHRSYCLLFAELKNKPRY